MSTDSATRKQSQILNVPNILSMIRLFMAFIVVGVIPFSAYPLALVLFVVAASTDWIDGWWARKFDQVTQLGRILDPFCDKMIICGTYIVLAVEMRDYPWYIAISGWMAVVVVGREMLVTALRSFIEQSGGDFSAKMAGKLKMVFQCIAVAASLVMLTYTDV
ncbi:MAG: CDP-alcohol phosphatidyltransferase family protein, partial [Planctomycetota bacterium]|nr:CDP-alcohol phosphatidyltransferase family protein [Planctomycetota bacterium]